MFEEQISQLESKPQFTEYKSIEDLFSEMNDERENVSDVAKKSETPDDDFDEDKNNDNLFDEKKENKPIIVDQGLRNKVARHEARFVTKSNDSLNAFICSLIADDDFDKFKLDKDELKEFEDIIFDYRKESDKHLPVWLQIAGYIVAAYGPLYKKAFDLRKLNKLNKQLEAENKQQAQILHQQNLQILEFINKQKEAEKTEPQNTEPQNVKTDKAN